MKIRTKMMAWFMVTVCSVLTLILVLTNTGLRDHLLLQKAEEYAAYTRQLLTTVSLVTKDLDTGLTTLYNTAGLAQALSASPGLSKTLDVETRLRYMSCNTGNFDQMTAADLTDNLYKGSSLVTELSAFSPAFGSTRLEELKQTFTRWFSDENGSVYLKKDVYTVSPLAHTGMLIARLKTEPLKALLGLSKEPEGMTAILSGSGEVVLMSGAMTSGLLSAAGETASSGRLRNGGVEYWLTREVSADKAWQVVRLVPVSKMLAVSGELQRISLLAGVAALLFSLAAIFAITSSLTKGVKRLSKAMGEVSEGRFDVPVPIYSKDEIGMLADRFRWLLSRMKQYTAELVEKATRQHQAEYALLELKYRSLQNQVSPHFICNILSTVSSLALMGKQEDVSRLAQRAGRYLRTNLLNAEEKRCLLAQELRTVEEYLALYREVYGDGFQFKAEAREETLECAVPHMILQPLVENALVHGGNISGRKLRKITLRAELNGERLLIAVSDNGCGIGPEVIAEVDRASQEEVFDKKHIGFGLMSIVKRLRLLYGGNQSIRIESKPREGTVITIDIPCDFHLENEAVL